MANSDSAPLAENLGSGANLVVGVGTNAGQDAVTARKAGGLSDMLLCISPGKIGANKALQNLAKALNVALQADFLESDLDKVYKVTKVRNGAVHMIHRDYIGLGDGWSAQVGRTVRSFKLTLRGPDAASPEGKDALRHEPSAQPISGMLNLVGRKLNLLREFEDQVPTYVEQMLDRLEAVRMITDWHREEWAITTTAIGLDVLLTPVVAKTDGQENAAPAADG